MLRPAILDFDGSVAPLDGASVVPLRDLEEDVRFGCRVATLRQVRDRLPAGAPGDDAAVTFLGSGDFHHVSYLLVQALQTLRSPVRVVVFDNHPDNARYPFGIHCGSWISHVARLPFVSRVDVAGICSADVEGFHAFENHVGLLRSGRVNYWCVRRNLRLLNALGARTCRSFDSTDSMLDALLKDAIADPVYLSIDKDVLSGEVVQTNWDQGAMRLEELSSAIRTLRPAVVAADITGDVSTYRYRSVFKRVLSRLDSQPEIDALQLGAFQQRHHAVNAELLSVLTAGRDETRRG